MKKLMIFTAIMMALIFYVWPTGEKPQALLSEAKKLVEKEKKGFEKFKDDTHEEFNNFKSKH